MRGAAVTTSCTMHHVQHDAHLPCVCLWIHLSVAIYIYNVVLMAQLSPDRDRRKHRECTQSRLINTHTCCGSSFLARSLASLDAFTLGLGDSIPTLGWGEALASWLLAAYSGAQPLLPLPVPGDAPDPRGLAAWPALAVSQPVLLCLFDPCHGLAAWSGSAAWSYWPCL